MTDFPSVASPQQQQEMLVRLPLAAGWEMASSTDSRTPDRLDDLTFIPARIPGTAAAALLRDGAWQPGSGHSLDAAEYWFRCNFDSEPAAPDEEIVLEMEGIATLSEVWLNGRHILDSSSMFASHRVDVSSLLGYRNELVVVCRSLVAALRARRGQQPRARWRTRVVSEQQLRWFRTTLLGRAPGFAPEPAPVGPWRPVTLLRRRHIAVEQYSRQAGMEGTTGVVRADLLARTLQQGAKPVSGWLQSGPWSAPIEWKESGEDRHSGRAVLRIPDARLWWPHTHGRAALYPLRAELRLADGAIVAFDDVPVGFRSLKFRTGENGEPGATGFIVNDVSVFCRGVVWTPPEPVALSTDQTAMRQRLELLRDGGFNLIRLAGTTVYESETFHRLCDELGLLVWQDMMFANMDYPFADSAFMAAACKEAERELSRIARHPGSALICGNSEIEQQAAMLGLDGALGRGVFFGQELPRIAARCCPDIPYVPSAPSGGDLPFRARRGVANYFGVGAYLRPLEDVRRADVRFASECLAFSNIPEPETIDSMALANTGGISPAHPAWERAIQRDSGAGWDFEDVRDHYLKLLYALDPVTLRHTDIERYWELSRMVSGEVMAEVFGEWRRSGSRCGGGIVLWSADLKPGAGWGILDSGSCPKAAYWHLKRALAPCTVWTTDEGLNGIDVHVSNEGPVALDAWLRVAFYAHGDRKVEEAEREITLAPRSGATFGVEQILGRFVDASCAYRFGPPAFDTIAVSLHARRGESAFAQAFRFPCGRSAERIPIAELGLTGHAYARTNGTIDILLSSRRFANGVRIVAANALPDDSYFGMEPGTTRRIVLTPLTSGAAPGLPASDLFVTAVNAEGRVPIAVERMA